MKKNIIMASMILMPALGFCQLGGMLKRVKQTVASTTEDKVSGTASSAVNKGIENVFRKSRANGTMPDETQGKKGTVAETSPAKPSLKTYSRFDFVAGSQVVYAEDFSTDAIGEFPLNWTTKAKGNVETIQGLQGKWLKGYKDGEFISVNKNELGDNYTVEFDLIYYFAPKEDVYVWPNLHIGVLNNYTVDFKHANGNISERSGEESFSLNIHPMNESSAWIETYGTSPEFTSSKSKMPFYSQNFNKVQHYAIQVQKSRVRVWIDENKIFDLPQVVTSTKKMARLRFAMGSTSFDENEVGYYVSNIRIANGAADTRHKLINEGKFSTSGILFAHNSAEIQPGSYGILKEIAAVLAENPDVKVKIIGHTSSDGNPQQNLELSRKRALSVKTTLEQEFNLSGTRLQADGKGDTQPASSNATSAGRAQNRRVEFIKL
jgi:outer membrane protein OmpA-like peptidoglycan-associated protein